MSDAAVTWNYSGRIITLGDNTFSSPPTIAEINSCSDWAQLFAVYNRRQTQIYSSPTLLTLDTSWPIADDINTLRDNINTMRVDYNLAAHVFGTDLSSGEKVRIAHLLALQAALSFHGPVEISCPLVPYGVAQYYRIDRPLSTFESETTQIYLDAAYGITNLGPGPGTSYERIKAGISFAIPTPSSTFNSSMIPSLNAQITVPILNGTNNIMSHDTLIYLSSSDDSAYGSGWQNNTSTLLYNALPVNGITKAVFSFSAYVSKIGSHLSFIFANADEIAASFANNCEAGEIVADVLANGGTVIQLDFGF